jgi:hypothetical protein
MSALLDAVEIARERRDAAERAFREALERACERHSLRVVARAARMSHTGVKWHIERDKRKGKA